MWSNDLFSPMMTMTCLIGVAVLASSGRTSRAVIATIEPTRPPSNKSFFIAAPVNCLVPARRMNSQFPLLAIDCPADQCLQLMLWTAPPPARECHECGCYRSPRSDCDGRKWHLASIWADALNGRYWRHSGHSAALARNASVAFDPKETSSGRLYSI